MKKHIPAITKKVTALALSTFLAVTGCTGIYAKDALKTQGILCGDTDKNREITSTDALNVLKAVVKLFTPDDAMTRIMDVDGDSEVTADDALMILKYVVKLIDHFDVENTNPSTGPAETGAPAPTDAPVVTEDPEETGEPSLLDQVLKYSGVPMLAAEIILSDRHASTSPDCRWVQSIDIEKGNYGINTGIQDEDTEKHTINVSGRCLICGYYEEINDIPYTVDPLPEPDVDILICKDCGSVMDLIYSHWDAATGIFTHWFFCDTCHRPVIMETNDSIDVCPNCDTHTGKVIWDSTKDTEDIGYYHYHYKCNTCGWDGGRNGNAVGDHIDSTDFFNGCAGYSYLAVAFYDDGVWWDYDHPYEVPMPNHKHYECSQCGRRW